MDNPGQSWRFALREGAVKDRLLFLSETEIENMRQLLGKYILIIPSYIDCGIHDLTHMAHEGLVTLASSPLKPADH